MPIYTKTGDEGTTGLYGGKRILKSDIQVEAYGSLDELTSFIGLVATKKIDKNDLKLLTEIQNNLYKIMAFLAGNEKPIVELDKQVNLFEQEIDKIQLQLPELKRFIVPGGTEISSWFHILRVIARRAERNIVRLKDTRSPTSSFRLRGTSKILDLRSIICYINRMSDLFFVIARKYNQEKEIKI